jgi:hypothetical protein
VSVVVTISAPIRLPTTTVNELKTQITALLAAGIPRADNCALLHGNTVRMTLIEQSSNTPMRFIGFVHNPDSAPGQLLDLAEQWLHTKI